MNDCNYVCRVFYYEYSVLEMVEILTALPMQKDSEERFRLFVAVFS